MKEIYKDVPGYEGLYQVSNLGNVKSLGRFKLWRNKNVYVNEKILKQSKVNNYPHIVLHNKGIPETFKVHQLLAIVFLNHKPCGYKLVVNHINFNTLDNRVENLEIVTQRENANKKHIKSSSKYLGVLFDKTRNKYRSQIQIDGKNITLGRFKNEYDAHLTYQKSLKEHLDNKL